MQQPERRLWPWVVALLVIAASVAAYIQLSGSGAASTASADSTAAASDDSSAVTTGAPSSDSGTTVSPPPAPAAAAAAPGVSPQAPPTTATVTDSGAVRLRGVPAGSTVQIDQRTPTGAVTVLPIGRHEIAISAPLHDFYVDTVMVTTGDTLDITPELTRLGARAPAADRRARRREAIAVAGGACDPGPAYDAAQCFDQRPRPMEAPFVNPPSGVREPERGTQLWVRVSAVGGTSGTRIIRSSGSPGFDVAAVAFVRRLGWEPAVKAGEAIAAWTQIEVRPAP